MTCCSNWAGVIPAAVQMVSLIFDGIPVSSILSVAALCLSSNLNYENLSLISSLAGGIVCEEVGVVPISKEKLLTETMKILIDE